MKKTLVGIAAASLLMLGTAAQAQQMAKSPLYGELGYAMLKFDDADIGALKGTLGYDVHPNIAVEGMLGFGVKDDTVDGSKLKLSNMFGVYAKPKFNVTPQLEVYGRLGYTRLKTKLSGDGDSGSGSDGDVSYGVGVNYNVTPTVHIGADYMNYFDKDGGKVDGVTLSVGFRF